MAIHAGSEGVVKVSDKLVAEVKSWSIEETCDTVDSSIIGTKWKKNLPTIRSWSGSIDGFWDDEDAEGQGKMITGNIVDIKLFAGGVAVDSKFFTGKAIVTGISRQASFDGLVEISFTFQGNNELKIMADEEELKTDNK